MTHTAYDKAITCDVHTSSQYVTLYYDGKPVATAQRKRVLENSPFQWSLYATDGALIKRCNVIDKRAVAKYLKIDRLIMASWHQERSSVWSNLARQDARVIVQGASDFSALQAYHYNSRHAEFHASQARLYMGI